MAEKVLSWVDERLGLTGIYNLIFDRKVPKVNWWFTLGSATLFLFFLQIVTGVFLTVYYVPSPDHAYDSIQYIMNGVTFGWLIRGIHHWGASLMVVFVFAHMLRTFFMAAYKFPGRSPGLLGSFCCYRRLEWVSLATCCPGTSRAYWATTVGTEIAGTMPLVGGFIERVLRGGNDLERGDIGAFFRRSHLVLPGDHRRTAGDSPVSGDPHRYLGTAQAG